MSFLCSRIEELNLTRQRQRETQILREDLSRTILDRCLELIRMGKVVGARLMEALIPIRIKKVRLQPGWKAVGKEMGH